MQVHVGEQRRNHCSLRRSYLRLRPLTVFRNSRLQPFLDQAKYPVIGHAMRDELHDPLVAHVVEEATNIRIEHPIHSLPLDARRQRVQRLMRAATGPEPVREAFEVDLIDMIEDRHHGLLNDFVLQCRDAQWTSLPIGLRNIDSSGGLCPIPSTVHPSVQIEKSILQPGFILLPRHAIDSRRSLTLECVKAIAEYSDAQMVEQSGELFLLPLPCYLPPTAQSQGHACPALCRTHVRLRDVLLSLCPSLPSLRRSLLPFIVRLVHGYYGTVRLLLYVHVRSSVYGLRGPVLIG